MKKQYLVTVSEQPDLKTKLATFGAAAFIIVLIVIINAPSKKELDAREMKTQLHRAATDAATLNEFAQIGIDPKDECWQQAVKQNPGKPKVGEGYYKYWLEQAEFDFAICKRNSGTAGQ